MANLQLNQLNCDCRRLVDQSDGLECGEIIPFSDTGILLCDAHGMGIADLSVVRDRALISARRFQPGWRRC